MKIAEVILNHITSRTIAGLDKNNKKFKKYSEEYADRKGVGRNDVDLILSGEMIESLELVSHKNGEIVIGYKDPSDELAGKVEGNRTGSYGKGPDPKKARDFLGIDKDELDILLESFRDEEEKAENLDDIDIDALARELANEMFE